MATKTMTIIDDKLWQGSQSWNYRRTMKYGDNKVKLVVKRDSYDHQSYIVGYVLDPVHLKWNKVATIPFGKDANCFIVNAHQTAKPNIVLFALDADAVFELIKELLD